MNDTSKNILLSDVQGQGFLSIFNDLSSELMPHELSLLELMEGLDYNGFDSSLKRDASVDPKDMAIIIVYSYMMGHTSSRSIERLCRRDCVFAIGNQHKYQKNSALFPKPQFTFFSTI